MQDAASPMGCIAQWQFCNAKGQCGDLASFADALASAVLMFDGIKEDIWNGTDPSGATALRFNWFEAVISQAIDLREVLESLGAFSLLSHQSLDQGFMGPLPDNQWQLDVIHWWGTILSSYQAAFVNVANGPNDASLMPYTLLPTSSYADTLCRNQVRLSSSKRNHLLLDALDLENANPSR